MWLISLGESRASQTWIGTSGIGTSMKHSRTHAFWVGNRRWFSPSLVQESHQLCIFMLRHSIIIDEGETWVTDLDPSEPSARQTWRKHPKHSRRESWGRYALRGGLVGTNSRGWLSQSKQLYRLGVTTAHHTRSLAEGCASTVATVRVRISRWVQTPKADGSTRKLRA